MDGTGLEEWRMTDAIAALTRSYLESPEIKKELWNCAEGLLNPYAFEDLAPSYFMVPYERNRFFTGRDGFIKKLRDTFQINSNPESRYHGRVALFGLGGIGKTQIALEFVYRSQTSYRGIYWISAITQESLLNGYEKIGKQANIPITQDLKLIAVVEQVLLQLKRTPNWLLVVDNLDDIDVLSTQNLGDPNIINLLLPELGPGQHTMITTRNPNADHIPAQAKEVSLFKEADSVALLSSLSGIPILPGSEEEKVVQQIAKELGNLPLALSQAGAYIKQKSGGFAQYLKHYTLYRSRVNSWIPKGPRPYPHSVATTWIMSFNEIRKSNSTAARLFQLLAFFNPDGILIEFLKSGTKGMDNDLERLVFDEFEFTEALSSFEMFSLIKWDKQSNNIVIHRLVQAVVKDEMSEMDLTTFRPMMVDMCDQAFPEGWNNDNRALCRRYIGQVMGPLVDPDASETVKFAEVMYRVGWFLRDDGKIVDSEHILVRSRKVYLTILGVEHPDTLRSMNNLAATYRDQGRRAEAAALQEEVLEKRRRILGVEHPDTLRSMTA